ncbi:Y-family DNA polymerase, partial [Malacoplasma iowae]|uniref:DNA polymerase IV n=2 Tax=Malacoplasma iowae TaxID=2116 RepID=A0A084U4W7_MALIO
MEYNIFHIDMDSFYASAEMADKPELKNKPVCVGSRNKHGIISSANYVARSFGVKAAMKIYEAKRLCPSLVVLDVNMNKYIKVSDQIYLFLNSLTPNVEIGSIDEWYLDTNGSKYESWNETDFAFFIKSEILKRFNLNCTIGCSHTKFLAKMATNYIKPNGHIVFTKENFKDYIYPLSIGKMFFVGKKLENFFLSENIKTIGDLVNTNQDLYFYKKIGVIYNKLKNEALGISKAKVDTKSNYQKAIGRSFTIDSFTETKEFLNLIDEMVLYINNHLKINNASFMSLTLRLKLENSNNKVKTIRYPLSKFKVDIVDAISMFESITYDVNYKNIYNISLTANELIFNISQAEQIDMFDKTKSDNNPFKKISNDVNEKLNKKIIYLAKDYFDK